MAVEKRIRIGFIAVLFLWFSTTFPRCFSATNRFQTIKKPSQPNGFGSSAVFPVQGNVYPLGYYSVSLKIGRPPKLFDLDIDSGSDLTWVQCDAPCTGCTRPREGLYKPNNNLLHCVDPLCNAIETLANHPCDTPNDQCDYEVEYADHGSSLGVLVKDYFPLRFTNGSLLGPHLAFGCGYDQKYDGTHAPPSTAGVLGLGNGKASIVTQLSKLGLIRNVAGHCLSGKGGYIFFGDEVVPSTGITWTPMSRNSYEKHYSSGPAELHYGGKPIGVNGLEIVFDSGSSYTYFSSKAYEAVVNQLKKDLNGKPLKDATDDRSLPVCWKGAKPFKSVNDVKNYFKPFALSFNAKKAQLRLPPEAYLIITKHGNVCLGVLNGSEVGLGSLSIIGDISLLDKMVIYDNEKQQIGWVPENCDRLPNVDREFHYGFSHPFARGNLHMMADYCPANMFHKESSKDRYQ